MLLHLPMPCALPLGAHDLPSCFATCLLRIAAALHVLIEDS